MATVSDNFNRSDGDLDASTASGGGTWDEFVGTNFSIVSNTLQHQSSNGHNTDAAKLDVDLDGDDHEVETDVTSASGSPTQYCSSGVIGRKDSSSTFTCYSFVYRFYDSDFQLGEYTAASFSDLGTGGTPSLPDNIRLHLNGSAITGYVNDVSTVNTTDTSITGNTRVGVVLTDGNISTNKYIYHDNFLGADLAAAGRTTYNTDSHPLGVHTGMAFRMNQP